MCTSALFKCTTLWQKRVSDHTTDSCEHHAVSGNRTQVMWKSSQSISPALVTINDKVKTVQRHIKYL